MSKKPRPLTAQRLERAALRYLDRYSVSRAQLRSFLERRVERARYRGDDVDSGWVDDVIRQCESWGYVDDARFAMQKAKALRSRGKSTRHIQADLRRRGVDPELVRQSLGEQSADAELEAARKFAKRRRLGAWRKVEADAARRNKELAAMGRAGFSYEIAKRVVAEGDSLA